MNKSDTKSLNLLKTTFLDGGILRDIIPDSFELMLQSVRLQSDSTVCNSEHENSKRFCKLKTISLNIHLDANFGARHGNDLSICFVLCFDNVVDFIHNLLYYSEVKRLLLK